MAASSTEPLVVHRLRPDAKARRERVEELLEMVALRQNLADRHPVREMGVR